MKISEVTSAYILGFIRAENDEQARKDLRLIMPAAKSYLRSYTKLNDQELDRHDDITLAYIALCQHMYDNRTFAVDCKEANRVIESIIGLHDCNLVG
ncbi:MAG: phage gp6-like head-tail connector protein [Oscillospiraceae bacterium]|nr:phage gp6-like head-tail connector protein [Oscillospiraceae bacterium]